MATDANLTTTIKPVSKEISVPLAPERAFALFTDGVAGWWPLRTHSVAGDGAVSCRFEPRVGGRLLETAADGSEHVWGTLLEWDPPARLVMSWHPGRTPEAAQQVSITFTPDGDGTRLRLVHTGWERLAEVAPRERDSYDSGWDYVLGLYADGADRS